MVTSSRIQTNERSFKYWAPIAYTRFMVYVVAVILKTTVRKVLGLMPKEQTWRQGVTVGVLKLIMGATVLTIPQSRQVGALSNQLVNARAGLLTRASKDAWATPVQGQGWKGFWIPFQDQLHSKKNAPSKHPSFKAANIGAECDIVFLAIHGGGFVLFDALLYLHIYKDWMKAIQKTYNLKVGFLSVEYSLAPEAPFPAALDECIAAYRHLVEGLQIDPNRILMCGDSAGANLCITSCLKMRDNLPNIQQPAGLVLFSPYLMTQKVPHPHASDDYIAETCEVYVASYTGGSPQAMTSPYASPLESENLKGLPRQIVFIGGAEYLRPSIELYVQRLAKDGVAHKVVLKEGKPHDYAILAEVGGVDAVAESTAQVANFVALARERYIGIRAHTTTSKGMRPS